MIRRFLFKLQRNEFLFEELVKRDFKKKYKRTMLGMAWSVLSPLLTLLVMSVVFSNILGRNIAHYTIYLFCGNLVFSYFRESTNGGMRALLQNATIFTKVNIPKYLFVLSKNVSALINFSLTMVVFLIFVLLEGLRLNFYFFALIYPICCLVVFNIGVGLILSALLIFFRDMAYLYDIFTMLLMYVSVIFYSIKGFSPAGQKLFLLNPIYCYIAYFRAVVLEASLPSAGLHLLCAFYAFAAAAAGAFIYKKYNQRFLYYV